MDKWVAESKIKVTYSLIIICLQLIVWKLDSLSSPSETIRCARSLLDPTYVIHVSVLCQVKRTWLSSLAHICRLLHHVLLLLLLVMLLNQLLVLGLLVDLRRCSTPVHNLATTAEEHLLGSVHRGWILVEVTCVGLAADPHLLLLEHLLVLHLLKLLLLLLLHHELLLMLGIATTCRNWLILRIEQCGLFVLLRRSL